MKKPIIHMAVFVAIALTLSSCYIYTMNVGKGAQTGIEVR